MLGELIRERVRFPGRQGALAGELSYPLGATRFAALLVNPHPHMGGRTGNNLVARLAETLAAAGGVALSFDYAGVGDSDGPGINVAASMEQFWVTGRAPEDPQMIQDVRRARDWLRSNTPLPLALIGYSFGAYAVTEALDEEVRALLLISPAVGQHDLSPLTGCRLPKLILYSDNDFAASPAAIEAWIDTLASPTTAQCFTGGEHFFRDREDEVAAACVSFIKAALQFTGRE